ncbi:hypothetical protein D3C76_1470800 [compost metagenome]
MGHNRCVERKFIDLIVVIGSDHAHFAVVTFGAADHSLIINRTRQNKTVVVISVLTDQIDAARSLNRVSGRVAEFFSKQGLCFIFQTHLLDS